MTREKAIRLLATKRTQPSTDWQMAEACTMAIKALEQEPCEDAISRQAAINAVHRDYDAILDFKSDGRTMADSFEDIINALPSVQPEQEDYTEMKREFLRMASYIDSLLVCPDEQKETLMNFISRIAEFMPWTERD